MKPLTPLQKRNERRNRNQSMVDMNLVSLIDVFTILIFFLMSNVGVETLASTRAVTLPESMSQKAPKETVLVTVTASEILVGDKVGGLIQRIADTPKGHDLAMLNALLFTIKAKFPDKADAAVLAEQNTPYDSLVHVMDAVRSGRSAQGGTTPVRVDLFPNISVGDAPMAKR